MTCLAPETVLGMIEGRLADSDAAAVDDHLDVCPACRLLVRVAARATRPRPEPVDPVGRGTAVGRYLILEKIGGGAMGVVYAAYDPELDRKVALKLIRPELAGARAAARLLREGRAIARLAHPNVISVYDLGRYADGVFVAMELVDGVSLAGWLAERERPWTEVLAMFRQAGAGLIAAHAAGLVHRDFKPMNVLVGRDGRVRVGDFGLARLDTEGEDATPASTSDVQITQSGVLVGTPAYMAPEQFEGRVDAGSDQFSFAVALWEALYRERPFHGASALEIASSIESSRPTAPATSPVPVRVRDALLRALDPEPNARFPSMEAMLAALAPSPRRRLAWLIAASAAVTALAVVVGTQLAQTPDTCAGADDELRGVWDVEQRVALAHAFAAVAKPYAGDALGEVERGLDRYTGDWVAMKTESCTATVRRVQTEQHQGLRDVCLAERLVDVKALVDVLAQADADVVARAPQAVARLPELAPCADLRTLAQAAVVSAPPLRTAPIEGALAAADALGDAGKYEPALALARHAVDDARAIGAHRLVARALELSGWLAHRAGHQTDAVSMLDDAIDEAEIARDDRTAARAWVTLVSIVGATLGRYDEGLAIARHASAAIERLGGEPLERARLESHRGHVFVTRHHYKDALAAYEVAHAIRTRLLPADDLRIADSLDELAEVYERLDRYADARAAYQRGVAIRETKLGPDHPDLALAHQDLGRLHQQQADYAGAEKEYRLSAQIAERALGPHARMLGHALFDLSNAIHDDPGAQLRTLRRAIAIFDDSHDFVSLSSARQLLAIHLSRARDFDAAERELDLANAAAVEGHIAEHDSAYWLARAEVYSGQRRLDLAEQAIRSALAFDERVYGAQSSKTAEDHGYLGRLYADAGKYELALTETRQELAIQEKVLGPDHTFLTVPLANIGLALAKLGRYGEAIPHLTRALALDEKAFGKTSGDLAVELWGIGDAQEHLGRHADAIATLERALALDHAADAEEPYRNAQLSLAIALWNGGRDRARAVKLAAEARAGFAKLGLAPELAKADGWLAGHR